MRTVFKKLISVRLRHEFYKSGRSVADFSIRPSPATDRRLRDYGLVFRRREDGFALFAEIQPGSDPPVLFKPIGKDTLRFAFLLQAVNPYLENISEVPQRKPGRKVFYFNNLRHDPDEGRLLLSDSVAGARVGSPVQLVSEDTMTYRFAAPVAGAALKIEDMFGNTVHQTSFRLPAGKKTPEYRLDLRRVKRMPAGRYRVSDDGGPGVALYFDPELFGGRPFGVVEIFSRTDTLTSNGVDRVPQSYRFLKGSELTGVDYHLQLAARSTTWRYQVVKKYGSNGVDLNQVAVVGGAFNKSAQPGKAVFTSVAGRKLSEKPPALELKEGQKKLRDLPGPSVDTPLQKGAAAGKYVSELHVYV